MNINFMGHKITAYIFSTIIILVGIISLFNQGLNFGIDFRGGTLYQFKFEKSLSVKELRKALSDPKFKFTPNEIVLQAIGEHLIDTQTQKTKEFIINLPNMDKEKRNAIKKKLKDSFGKYEELKEEAVGPTVGDELKRQAFKAMLISICGILLYISIRFQFRFGIAAIAALIHDCLVVIGLFSIFKGEITISMIAALLTIIGYSLNDTIVIMDRIRENLRIMRKDSFKDIVNKSINQSLSRTINTSLTTLFPVCCLAFFGGAVLKNFAMALLIGVIIGTYSSIYVVSSLIVEWQNYSPQKN